MIQTSSASPWGSNDPIDLSRMELSVDQKAWFGSELAGGMRTLQEPHDT